MSLGHPCCGSLVSNRHYEDCPRNNPPENRLARNTSSDPTGNKLLKKISSIEPAPDDSKDFGDRFSRSFSATVRSMEERTTTVIEDTQKYGEALGESKAAEATAEVSLGWWLSLEDWPISIPLGSARPENMLKAGDPVEITIRQK